MNDRSGARWSIRLREFADLLTSCGFLAYEDFARSSRGDAVSRTGTSETRRLELRNGARSELVFLKQYRYGGPRTRSRFRRHKGAIEARNYERLRRCGVPVPDVVALGSRCVGWQLADAFIMTRGIRDARPLDEAWPQRSASTPADRAWRRAVAERLLEIVTRMHRRHFYHIDLQWRNILVADGPRGPELTVIDSSRGGRRWSPWMRRHCRLRDLASLDKSARQWVSRTDRVRWLKRYSSAAGRAMDWRDVARWIGRDRARKQGAAGP